MSGKFAARRIAFALLLLCATLGLWLTAQGTVHLIAAPPPQLIAGETATLHFSSARAGSINVRSSDANVASIQVQSVSGDTIACTVTAHTDGVAVLSCTVGGRQSPAYAVSIVPPVPAPLTSGEFVASKNSNKFHLAGCTWVDRIQQANRVYFAYIDDAYTAGYTSCAQCMKS